jgi:hypothetical protein
VLVDRVVALRYAWLRAPPRPTSTTTNAKPLATLDSGGPI